MSSSIDLLSSPRQAQGFRYTSVTLVSIAFASAISATTVIGRVYTEDGNPVKSAIVTVQSSVATPSVQSKAVTSGAQYKALTDDQGKFTLNLPNGQYTVCVRADNRRLLDSCQWFLDENVIQVRAGFSPFKVVLRAGLVLRIRLNDPLGLWPQVRAPLQSSTAVGFTVYDALGYSHPVIEVSGDDKGRNFEVLVPANRNDYRLAVQGRLVDVVDQAGALASRAVTAPLSSAKSDLAQTRVYEIVPSGRLGTETK
jgi:hypothetical protein